MEEFENEDLDNYKSVNDYMEDVDYGTYDELTDELYKLISEEGWLEQLQEEYEEEYSIEDFEYTTLELTEEDSEGLINMEDDIVEKFNDFDIKLKETQRYPFDTLDFIDYDNGIVYVVNLI